MSKLQKPQDELSARPWTYHPPTYLGGSDWIEDARGQVIMENVGAIDGPFMVAAVNRAPAHYPVPTRECPQCRAVYNRNFTCCDKCDVALRLIQPKALVLP